MPVKDHSLRFPGKNFKEFYDGKNIEEIKIHQLLKHFERSQIVVVGDGPLGKGISDAFGLGWLDDGDINRSGFEFAVRFWFSEIVDDDAVMLTYGTTPLFNYYKEILAAWNREKYDSIFSGSIYRHFLTDEMGRPLNFQYGYFHRTSEYLPKYVQLDWSCFIIDGKVAREAKYPIGRIPQVFIQPPPSVDIDNKEDFELAQWYYSRNEAN